MKNKLILSVEKLQCKRNNFILFNCISFKVFEGGLVIIKGNNGTGKTSLLHSLCGLVSFEGKVNWKIEKKKIGYLGHHMGLKDYETAEEFIAFWKKIYNSKVNSDKIIKFFSLDKFLYKPIGALSFGQKKKLSFARLSLLESKIWLLDEPFSGMDNKNKKLIADAIKRHINKKGITILSTHDQTKLLNIHTKQEVRIV